MKAIPNCISFSRIIFSLILLFVKPLNATFYAIYIICGFSDMLDGFIARKTGTTSTLGEKIDSVADMVMIGVLLVRLYPIIRPTTDIAVWIVLIAMIRLAAMVIALIKYKVLAMLHTYGNKITGMVLFLLPILLLCIDVTALMYICCIVASLSAIEELAIHLTSGELQINKKSIFVE